MITGHEALNAECKHRVIINYAYSLIISYKNYSKHYFKRAYRSVPKLLRGT